MKRTFVAIEIPFTSYLKSCCDVLVGELSQIQVRWVDFCSLHVTLAFIGTTDEKWEREITEIIAAISKEVTPFDLTIKGCGVFGGSKPKVLWIGVDFSASLEQLAATVRKRLNTSGIAFDPQHFTPHITIGRFKAGANAEAICQLLSRYKAEPFDKISIGKITFYESILEKDRKPQYRAIKEFKLGSV